MDRDELSFIAHTDHPIACPFADHTVAALLERVHVPSGGTVLDIGCGRAEWLLRLAAARPNLRGIGVDRSTSAIAAAQARASALEVDGRITLVCADASRHLPALALAHGTAHVDTVLCLGSSHALGGYRSALGRLRALMRPRGYALVGEGFWQRPPTPAALDELHAQETDFLDLPGLVEAARAAGFVPLHVVTSSEREWDEYEWSWASALERHALHHSDTAAATEMQATARAHIHGYMHGYRGILGFAGLVLAAAD